MPVNRSCYVEEGWRPVGQRCSLVPMPKLDAQTRRRRAGQAQCYTGKCRYTNMKRRPAISVKQNSGEHKRVPMIHRQNAGDYLRAAR
ncbi:hypothetical protein HAX54_052574 [Datura stramonium]|uniref:Uncharacterized protein n=1 Tax=Datura stramonium TaxID=4076 RepID=A0ABS8WSG2_DATST|nr:hypothetical protein [Datura stramonium]